MEEQKETNRYQSGKIYKIVSLSHPDLVYYGSTICSLAKRFSQHKAPSYNRPSKQITQYEGSNIYLVENYPCNSKEELTSREGYYILNNDCINKVVPGRILTNQEYYEINSERIKQQVKKYREENQEKVKESEKRKYEKFREKILVKNKQRYEENKEKILEKRKLYGDAYREKIKERNQKKVICECDTNELKNIKN